MREELKNVRNLTEDSAHDIIVASILNSSSAKLFLMLTDSVQQEKLYSALTEAYLWLLELGLEGHEQARETKNVQHLNWDSIAWELDHSHIVISNWTPDRSFWQDLYDVNSLFKTANLLENLFLAEVNPTPEP